MVVMLTVALLFAVAPSASAPSPAELAEAIRRFSKATVAAQDLRHIACRPIPEEATEAQCNWQRRHGKRWYRYAGYLAVDGSGWLLIDTPTIADRRR